MSAAPLVISIDFEDFAHDLKRQLGIWETGPLRAEALWQSYEDIHSFLMEIGTTATFFCTGVIGQQMPDLIARIARDGNEVACHAFHHDNLDTKTPEAVEHALALAKDVLETAAGAPVSGFRAPNFRIDKVSPAQYHIVERLFTYDSSLCVASPADVSRFRQAMGLTRLKLLPIFRARPARLAPPLKLGGSYLKLFPLGVSERLLSKCDAAQMVPHVYVHPYEFARQGEYKLSAAELDALGRKTAAYWALRQHQWHTVGNQGLAQKLARLARGRRVLGSLRDNVDTLAA